MHLTMAFTAGQRVEFVEQGDFFRVMEATADIKVEFYREGREVAEAVDVRGGYAERFENYFTSFAITSGSAQTVKFASRLGNVVDYNQAPTGNVNVTNASLAVTGPLTDAQLRAAAVPVSGALTDAQLRAAAVPVSGPLTQAQLASTMVATTQPVDLIQADVDALRRPEQSNGNLSHTAAMVANTAVQVVAPASNVNGLLLLSAWMNDFDANGMMTLVAKSSAPTSITDGEVVLAGMIWNGQFQPSFLTEKQLIAPGLGLYFISNVATTVSGTNMRTCRWRLL